MSAYLSNFYDIGLNCDITVFCKVLYFTFTIYFLLCIFLFISLFAASPGLFSEHNLPAESILAKTCLLLIRWLVTQSRILQCLHCFLMVLPHLPGRTWEREKEKRFKSLIYCSDCSHQVQFWVTMGKIKLRLLYLNISIKVKLCWIFCIFNHLLRG